MLKTFWHNYALGGLTNARGQFSVYKKKVVRAPQFVVFEGTSSEYYAHARTKLPTDIGACYQIRQRNGNMRQTKYSCQDFELV